MGLDMYLYARKYESKSSFNNKDGIAGFYPAELSEFAEDNYERNFLSKTTDYQIGYWRKANAIHKWIVDNCADGIDECQTIYVYEVHLKELYDLVCKVLDNRDLAPKLLPTSEGFFFGSQEYDDWYFEDLLYTKDLLFKVINFLQEHKDYSITYEASW